MPGVWAGIPRTECVMDRTRKHRDADGRSCRGAGTLDGRIEMEVKDEMDNSVCCCPDVDRRSWNCGGIAGSTRDRSEYESRQPCQRFGEGDRHDRRVWRLC